MAKLSFQIIKKIFKNCFAIFIFSNKRYHFEQDNPTFGFECEVMVVNFIILNNVVIKIKYLNNQLYTSRFSGRFDIKIP